MAEYYTDIYGVRRPILGEAASGLMSNDYEKQLQNNLGSDTDYIVPAYAFTQSSTADALSKKIPGTDSSTADALSKKIPGTDIGMTGNIYLDYSNSPGLFGISQGNWQNIGQAAGLAGTAYGLYDALAGNKSKLFKEQIGMLKEQRAANQEMLANKRKFNDTWANASNGLAASYGAPRVG